MPSSPEVHWARKKSEETKVRYCLIWDFQVHVPEKERSRRRNFSRDFGLLGSRVVLTSNEVNRHVPLAMSRGSQKTLTRVIRAAGVFVILSAIMLNAQGRPRPQGDPDGGPDNDRYDAGTSAGGNWTEYRAEDPMTAAKRVRFELPA